MKVLSRSWRVVALLALVLLALSLAACNAVAPQTQAPAQNENQAEEPDEEEGPPPTPVVVIVTPTPGPVTEAATAAPPATTDPNVQPTAQPTAVPPPGGQATGPVTRNEDWNPVIQERDGVEWVLVPTGTFTMGNEDGPQAENPENPVDITAPFWLMRTEVWNELYGGDSEDWTWRDAMAPAANYTWEEALAFCQTLGGRLPTEAEWEWAAKGPNNLTWTQEPFEPGFVITGSNSQAPQPVPTFIENASWVGAIDLLGNVAEWTSSAGGADYPYVASDGRENSPAAGEPMRVIRGGSYQHGASDMRNSWRKWIRFDEREIYVGIRCAADYQP